MAELPDHIKGVIQGGNQASNENRVDPAPELPKDDEPARAIGEILPPEEISDGARKWFTFYVSQADGSRRFVQGDSQGLAMLAEATADYWRLTEELHTMAKGQTKAETSARWTIASERSSREKLVERLLKEFGLTWKSRGNV